MSASARLLLTAAALTACLVMSDCGSGGSPDKRQATTSASAQRSQTTTQAITTPSPADESHSPTLVRIGQRRITKAGLLHWMAVVSPYGGHEVPAPPGFASCILALQKREPIDAGGEGRAANALKGVCQQRYETLTQTALSVLINDAWLLNEAAKDGIQVDQGAITRELTASSAQLARQPGGFTRYLAETGRNFADVRLELKVGQLSSQIYKLAERKTPALTQARIAGYYAKHKQSFAVPQTRDLYILHTKSEAGALQAKREIQSGKSFASVVAGLNVAQPIGAKKGLTLALRQKTYSEPILADAIFRARPGVLSGPVHVAVNPAFEAAGYYVFQVKRVIPAHQMSFPAAAAIIRAQAPEQLHRKTLAAFVKAYKERWKAQTDCSPGYVVEGCKQYSSSKVSRSSDPYVL